MFEKFKNWFRPGRKPPKMDAHKLTDITRGMHHAAGTTMATIAQQYIYLIEQFFDTEPDGTMVAKVAKVAVDEKHVMYVPLISLAAPKGIGLDRMVVDMTVRMENAEIKKCTDEVDNSEAMRSSFVVTMAPRSDAKSGRRDTTTMDVRMEFKAAEPPEGIMRLIENFTNHVRPIPMPPDEGAGPVAGDEGDGGGPTLFKSAGAPGTGEPPAQPKAMKMVKLGRPPKAPESTTPAGSPADSVDRSESEKKPDTDAEKPDA